MDGHHVIRIFLLHTLLPLGFLLAEAGFRINWKRSKRVLLKDGLQEVPKGDKWSRRQFSFPGNFCAPGRHLCPQVILKKAIKPNPQPDPRDHGFPGPPAFPTMQSFSSLLYK
jgi:hypothetical protein